MPINYYSHTEAFLRDVERVRNAFFGPRSEGYIVHDPDIWMDKDFDLIENDNNEIGMNIMFNGLDANKEIKYCTVCDKPFNPLKPKYSRCPECNEELLKKTVERFKKL